jgi:hypothetical protein
MGEGAAAAGVLLRGPPVMNPFRSCALLLLFYFFFLIFSRQTFLKINTSNARAAALAFNKTPAGGSNLIHGPFPSVCEKASKSHGQNGLQLTSSLLRVTLDFFYFSMFFLNICLVISFTKWLSKSDRQLKMRTLAFSYEP